MHETRLLPGIAREKSTAVTTASGDNPTREPRGARRAVERPGEVSLAGLENWRSPALFFPHQGGDGLTDDPGSHPQRDVHHSPLRLSTPGRPGLYSPQPPSAAYAPSHYRPVEDPSLLPDRLDLALYLKDPQVL